MVMAIDVSMNMIAHHVVAFERNVAAPRGPNAVWLPAPPKAPARSAASPLCSSTTMINKPQTRICRVTRTKYTFQPKASKHRPIAIEIAHLTSFGITRPALQNFTLLKIYDGSECLGVQTRATHKRPVNFHLRHQPLDIVGFDAAAVENSQPAGPFWRKHLRRLLPQESVRFRGNFRSRRAARADCPDRFVSKNDTRELRTGKHGPAPPKLPRQDLFGLAVLTLCQQLPHA